ncbi:hypothetical protein N0V84_010730 [Fusarium piperis]|uniref:Uncharacterized protein n=1 Tax=Fusarium piperis TaxID=1435070 RepID=A0A9W8W405_9HYPO|nr:hypothetical protein N0V84_010730 [Fusarium piperis]
MSHHTGPFPDQSNAALPNMAPGNTSNQPASQYAVQPPFQHSGPLNSHPPFRGPPSFLGQAAPGQGAGTGAHSGQHPMVNGNANGNVNGNMNGSDNSWVPSAHQFIANALRSSGLADMNHSMARPAVPMFMAPDQEFGSQHNVRAPPNSPAEGFSQMATAPANTFDSGTPVP